MLAGKNGHAQCVAVLLYIGSRILMKLVFLSAEFYKDYADCSEIEQKPTRPYIRIGVLINGVLWAVPFRSNIRHEHVIWTNEAKRCGMDFSKAVVIVDPERYIDSAVPHLRGEELARTKRRTVLQMCREISDCLHILHYSILKSTFRKIRSDQVKIDKSTAKGLEWPRLWIF